MHANSRISITALLIAEANGILRQFKKKKKKFVFCCCSSCMYSSVRCVKNASDFRIPFTENAVISHRHTYVKLEIITDRDGGLKNILDRFNQRENGEIHPHARVRFIPCVI